GRGGGGAAAGGGDGGRGPAPGGGAPGGRPPCGGPRLSFSASAGGACATTNGLSSSFAASAGVGWKDNRPPPDIAVGASRTRCSRFIVRLNPGLWQSFGAIRIIRTPRLFRRLRINVAIDGRIVARRESYFASVVSEFSTRS